MSQFCVDCNKAVGAGSVARFLHFYVSYLAPAWGVPNASSVKSVNQRQGYAAWKSCCILYSRLVILVNHQLSEKECVVKGLC